MRPHVLVVDASRTTRMELRASLSAAGFLVTACDTCMAARKALATRTFALMILDSDLPDASSINMLRELRAANPTEHMPIILLSDESEVKARIRGLSLGADACVSKPYDSAYIVACAQELVHLRESSPPSSVTLPAGRKILIVDDSHTYRLRLAEVLRQDRHDVIIAGSGEEALALLEAEPVDAVLLDLVMPGMDGIEACRRIRRHASWRHMHVLIMTALDDAAAKRACLTAGADDVIVKSPELELLKVHLRGLLKKARAGADDGEHASPVSKASALWRKQDGVPPGSLLDRVVMKSGMSSLIGPSTIARACERAGVDAKTMTPADLVRALPSIRKTLSMFLARDEAQLRGDAIAALAHEAFMARRTTLIPGAPSAVPG
jgi:DNA-binding response OmpR family regulator